MKMKVAEIEDGSYRIGDDRSGDGRDTEMRLIDGRVLGDAVYHPMGQLGEYRPEVEVSQFGLENCDEWETIITGRFQGPTELGYIVRASCRPHAL
jgi:hypothetical protein